MKIQAVNFLRTKKFKKNNQNINFKAVSKPNSVISLNGKELSDVIIKTNNIQIADNEKIKRFTIQKKDEVLGNATISINSNEDEIFLDKIETKEHSKRRYKGAGSELLKCCAEESIKKGYKKISCNASNSATPPYIFYFKNNFIISDDKQYMKDDYLYNASLHFIAKNGLSPYKILPRNCTNLIMELDEKGMSALLNNKRLYEERFCIEAGKTEINGIKYSAQFIQSPKENEYFLQILNDNIENERLSMILLLEGSVDNKGEKFLKIKRTKDLMKHNFQEVNEFASILLDNLAQKYL